jgi:hypothetical protein
MGLSGEAVMVSSDRFPLNLLFFFTDTASGRGVVVVHLRICPGRTAIGSPNLAPAAKTHHRLGYLFGFLGAHLSGVDHM